MSVSATNNISALTTPPDPNRVPLRTLNQHDFLKLVSTQFANQDPLNPTQETEFIGQMAQFTALEQARAMQQDMARLQASSLLGKTVAIENPDGELVEGTVTGVRVLPGGQAPELLIEGAAYQMAHLVSIRQAADAPGAA
jgi:flagellar basal-body rod modification protein FlgD